MLNFVEINFIRFIFIILLLITFPAIEASANTKNLTPKNSPVLMRADEIIYDETDGVVTARGNIELIQGERILLADQASYYQRSGIVTANGNISLLEPTGEVLFANYIELKNELRIGFLKNLRLLLEDGSRLAASHAERTNEDRKIMYKVVFSPCRLCPEMPNRPPIWQIRASKIIHNEIRRDMEYQDAVLELFGIPALYTPYLVHPDPSVKRRSGLLSPTLGHSDEVGFIYGQPYFYVLGPSKDIEIEPIVYTREGLILKSRYRQAFPNGAIDFKTATGILGDRDVGDRTSLQASADLEANFSLDDTWRTEIDFKQASSRTYNRRFRLGNEEVLTSRLHLEGFRAKNYASINALKFQGLRSTDNRRRQPIVLPSIEYSYESNIGPRGSLFNLDASVSSVTRQIGTDAQKLSLIGQWAIPYISAIGEMYKFTANLQTDFYRATYSDQTINQKGEDVTGRFFPQMGFNWKLPMIRSMRGFSHIIEPVVNIIAGPNGGNPEEIPNEDSQAFEYDDTNIFELNRNEGEDRITSGARIDYGLKIAHLDDKLGSSELFFGQSFQFWGNSSFDLGSGLEEELSDYVGRIHLSPTDWLDMLYRFRLNKDDLKPRRSELGIKVKNKAYQFSADYILLDEQFSTANFGNREQLDLQLNVRLNEQWISQGHLIQDLSDSSNRTRIAGLAFIYNDECFSIGIEYERRDLQDADIKPEDQIFLRLNFKHLGSI